MMKLTRTSLAKETNSRYLAIESCYIETANLAHRLSSLLIPFTTTVIQGF